MTTLSVSVIIPCYRCAATLTRAVASVVAQSRQPEQIILVDDFSDRETRETMAVLAATYGERWIQQVFLDRNVGAASARNAGWRIATGRYIAFLDADDAWHPNKLALQYDYMVRHPDIGLSGHAFISLGRNAPPEWLLPETPIVAQAVTYGSLLLSNRFVTPSVMLRRDLPFRFVDGQRHMEDHMLWMMMSAKGVGIVKLNLPLAALYKSAFGASGLSAQLHAMHRAELANYRDLHQLHLITLAQCRALRFYARLKYLRRLGIYLGRKKWSK